MDGPNADVGTMNASNGAVASAAEAPSRAPSAASASVEDSATPAEAVLMVGSRRAKRQRATSASTATDASSPSQVIMLVLMVGWVVASIIKRPKFMRRAPYTALVFIIGILVGILDNFVNLGAITKALNTLTIGDGNTGINPELFQFIFLPVLIFGDLFALDGYSFVKSLYQVLLLAFPVSASRAPPFHHPPTHTLLTHPHTHSGAAPFPLPLPLSQGVVVGTFTTAAIVHYGYPSAWNLTWTISCAFGAMLSATDPVSASRAPPFHHPPTHPLNLPSTGLPTPF